MTEIYNKLVRDEMPEIIKADGKRPVTRILEDGEYLLELALKLPEESKELIEDPSLEELADIYEIVVSLREALGFSAEELEAARLKKAETNGRFEDKIFLESVE
jgi:predicted house-cleaning noncanonical NTP pyrophosphatase (MazG superfamily)